MAYRNRRPAYRRRRPARRPRRKTMVKKTFAKKVLSIVNKEAETKYVSSFVQTPNWVYTISGGRLSQLRYVPASTESTAFTSGITSVAEIYAAIPKVYQGTDSINRIADKIQPVKCRLDLDICITTASDATGFDYNVHIFVLQSKAVKNLNNYTAIPITQLLDDGSGSQTSFDGTIVATQYPVENKLFTVLHHKVVHLQKPNDLANATSGLGGYKATTPGNGQDGYAKVSLNVPLPKTLTYDSSAVTYPQNTAPFLCIGWTRRDAFGNGTTADSTVSNCLVMGRTHLWFKDI